MIKEEKIEAQIIEYFDEIEIPNELDIYVKEGIKIGNKKNEKVINMKRRMKMITASAATITVAFIGTANMSPTFAKTMSEVPILKNLVSVITFGQYDYKEGNYETHIKTPAIEGLANKEVQETLNQKYVEENKKLYEQFKMEVAELKEAEASGHLGTEAGYEVKTNNEKILSIGRYIENIAGSSSVTLSYDTIDKQNEIVITLPSLFKDKQYIEVISENIKEQMNDQMIKDENIMYWIEGDEFVEGFKTIDSHQAFYITEKGKLIISFDEYEVAPGYMGNVEFEIPTEAIQEILVSNEYIK